MQLERGVVRDVVGMSFSTGTTMAGTWNVSSAVILESWVLLLNPDRGAVYIK